MMYQLQLSTTPDGRRYSCIKRRGPSTAVAGDVKMALEYAVSRPLLKLLKEMRGYTREIKIFRRAWRRRDYRRQ